ncbi:hypothetical protein [Agaribacterium haliotis]|uniref:hypothetical protein n=1 Tax=Agaribacterium haliotis TaxID=2013869 RepID=UPI0011775E1B|nr:hypothetical protein [Agaribacterium haliotis]
MSYRNGDLSTDDLNTRLKSNSSIARDNLTRSAYLKLKQNKPLLACKEALPSCGCCENIFSEGEFSTYSDFERCDDEIKKHRSLNKIDSIREPSFASALPEVLGGTAYYKCSVCSAVWQIVLPERAQRGTWQRVA